MKKGFTLIELLAVIVILAIIALIATPIVLNIINDSKESTVLRSADFYLDGVETAIATATLKNTSVKDGTYSIMSNGDICIGEYVIEDEKCTVEPLPVEIDGEKPNSGRITIIGGQIENISLNLGNKEVIKNNKGELVFGKYLTNYIKTLYSETKTATVNGIEYSLDETHSLMNDRLGSSEVDKLEGNIRYYGANPNNYIDIGDRDSKGNIIFWRIIGLFKDIEVTDEEGNITGTEDLVKIIRADKLTVGDINGFSWDYTSAGEYDNNWNDSTLQLMLNDEVNGYYTSGTTSYYNYVSKQDPASITLNFASTGLSSEAHRKVERVNWNLGGYSTTNDIYANAMYGYERAEDSMTWSGKIALMNPSDYGYSADLSNCQLTLKSYNDSTCTSTNWMYDSTQIQWTLNPLSSSAYNVWAIHSTGYFGTSRANFAHLVRPALYLKSDVGIVEEKETSEGLKYFVVE